MISAGSDLFNRAFSLRLMDAGPLKDLKEVEVEFLNEKFLQPY